MPASFRPLSWLNRNFNPVGPLRTLFFDPMSSRRGLTQSLAAHQEATIPPRLNLAAAEEAKNRALASHLRRSRALNRTLGSDRAGPGGRPLSDLLGFNVPADRGLGSADLTRLHGGLADVRSGLLAGRRLAPGAAADAGLRRFDQLSRPVETQMLRAGGSLASAGRAEKAHDVARQAYERALSGVAGAKAKLENLPAVRRQAWRDLGGTGARLATGAGALGAGAAGTAGLAGRLSRPDSAPPGGKSDNSGPKAPAAPSGSSGGTSSASPSPSSPPAAGSGTSGGGSASESGKADSPAPGQGRDPGVLLEWLADRKGSDPYRPSNRKLRLYACAVCRQFTGRLSDGQLAVLDACAALADGAIDDHVLFEATRRSREGVLPYRNNDLAVLVNMRCACNSSWGGDFVARHTLEYARHIDPGLDRALADLLRDTFGNPFRPAAGAGVT